MKKGIKIIFCLVTILIVFGFYAHTLNYSWKHFDDNIIFEEAILPIPKSFSEILEYIKLFGLNHHFEASNPFYSNVVNIRSNSFNSLIVLIVYLFFQKSAFLYHTLSLFFHILNTAILFLLLNNFCSSYVKNNSNLLFKIKYPLISALTLFWALNPLNIESVLFATNWGALLSYSLCLFIFYIYQKWSLLIVNHIIIFIFFLISLFNCEHIITFLAIIFFYLFIQKQPLKVALTKTSPLLLAFTIFILSFFISHIKDNLTPNSSNNINLVLERVLWLSPQIFVHFIKLILVPFHLSIDQTAFVTLSKSLFEPYAIGCSVLMYASLIIAVICFFRRSYNLFLVLFIPFFLALLPFLHIISPIYNLASERYLYFPLFFLTIGLAHIVFSVLSKQPERKIFNYVVIFLTVAITLTYSCRAYARTLDWKDSITLLDSAIKVAPNDLFKALRQETAASSIQYFSNDTDKSILYTKESRKSLTKAFLKFKIDEELYENKSPAILKFYGLDPSTLLAKTMYLISFCDYSTNNDPEKAFQIFSPYLNNLTIMDTQILRFVYKILFQTKRIDEAEGLLLHNLKQNKISSTLLIALSDLSEYKYNDLKSAEKYLLTSHKYFPYEPATLFGLQRLYRNLNSAKEFAFYSYLLGLRNHDPIALKDAAYIYIRLREKDKAKTIIDKLLKYYPIDEKTLGIKLLYSQSFIGSN